MYNWRLLLLALFAVAQPIAAFTNVVDGRHQCCSQKSRSLHQDSRVPLYGTDRFTKTVEAPLDQRNNDREDRRHHIRDRNLAYNRPSTSSPRIREDFKETKPDPVARSRQRDLVRVRNTNDERILSQDEKARIATFTRNFQSDQRNRKVITVSELRQNDRVRESSRLSRERETGKLIDDRLTSLDSRREARPTSRFQELTQITPLNRQSRNIVRRNERSDVARLHGDDLINQRQVPRDTSALRERSVRVDTRRFDNNNERRVSERRAEVNSHSRLTRGTNEIRNVRESRQDGPMQDRPNARLVVTRRSDQSRERREHITVLKETTNTIPRLSRDMTPMNDNGDRKSASFARVTDETNVRIQRSDNRREVRNDKRQNKENIEYRIRLNLREVRDNEISLNQRTTDGRKDMRNDVRRLRDDRVENRQSRLINTLQERTKESQRDIMDVERRNYERSTEIRREVRSVEAVRGIRRQVRNEERRYRKMDNQNQRDIKRVERMKANQGEIRDDTRRFRERNTERETRRTEILSDNLRDTRADERRFRENKNAESRLSESRFEGSRKSQSENRNNERRLIESREKMIRENRREIRVIDRRSSDRNIESRREIRSNEQRENQRQRKNDQRSEQHNYARRGIRSADRIREVGVHNRQVANKDEIQIRNNEKRFREREPIDENRREIGSERLTSDRRLDSRRTIKEERDNIEVRKARTLERESLRALPMQSKTSDISEKRDQSRIQIKSLNNNYKTMDREVVNTRSRILESARNRENRMYKIEKENEPVEESIMANWQYVFYTLQGIYLCGLLMQMVSNDSQKSKTGNWWQFNSKRLIKVD